MILDMTYLLQLSGVLGKEKYITQMTTSYTILEGDSLTNKSHWGYQKDRYLYCATDDGQLFYMNFDNFLSDTDYWASSSDYLVSFGVKNYNYSRGLNF